MLEQLINIVAKWTDTFREIMNIFNYKDGATAKQNKSGVFHLLQTEKIQLLKCRNKIHFVKSFCFAAKAPSSSTKQPYLWYECSTKSWLNVISPLADHYVVINLRQEGKIISTKETKGASGSNPVWNAPFLFDLPPGDIAQLPLVLEFIVMQVYHDALSGSSDSTVALWT